MSACKPYKFHVFQDLTPKPCLDFPPSKVSTSTSLAVPYREVKVLKFLVYKHCVDFI